MKKLKYAALIIFAGFIISFSAKTGFAQNSITGMVFDSSRKPVALIDVDLLDEYERFMRTSKTNGSGLYMFQGLRGGVYFVQVRTDGTNYKAAKERIQIGQTNMTNTTTGGLSGGEVAQINFSLEPRKNNDDTQGISEVVFAQNIPEEAEKNFESALKALEKGNQSEGIAHLKSAIGFFPDYFLALDRLGNEYLTQSKFAEAEDVFQKAITVNPKSFSSIYGLAAAQYKLQKRESALKALESAITLNPSSINSFFLLGKIQRELKEFDKSEQNLKKANELGKEKLPDIHWELALLYYYNLNRYEDAAKELERYLKTNPQANKEQINKLIKEMRDKAKEKS